jgi:hypothetical protein
VRGLIHGSVDASFVSRGRKKLKGVADSVEVFTVVPRGASVPRLQRVSRRGALLVAASGAILLVGLGAVVAFWPQASGPATTPGPTQERTAVVGALPIGKYQTARFSPKIHFAVTDLGWSVYRDTSDAIGLMHEFSPPGKLDIGRPGVVFKDACSATGESVPAGRTPAEFLAAAAQAPFLHVGETSSVNVGGQTGLSADIAVDPGAQAACGSLGGSGIAVFSLGGEFWNAQPGETVRVIALDTANGLIAFLVSSEEASATSVQALDDFFELADRIVASIRF